MSLYADLSLFQINVINVPGYSKLGCVILNMLQHHSNFEDGRIKIMVSWQSGQHEMAWHTCTTSVLCWGCQGSSKSRRAKFHVGNMVELKLHIKTFPTTWHTHLKLKSSFSNHAYHCGHYPLANICFHSQALWQGCVGIPLWYWPTLTLVVVSISFILLHVAPSTYNIYVARPSTTNSHIVPSELSSYRNSHRMLGPCCLCPLADQYPPDVVESAIYQKSDDPHSGEWVVTCSWNKCGYMGQLTWISTRRITTDFDSIVGMSLRRIRLAC